MPNTWLMCAENYLDAVGQFPNHVLTAEEEASGFDVERVANGRRSVDDYWTPTTPNRLTWARCVFDRPRAVNFVAMDRGHNNAGEALEFRTTQDQTDFTGDIQRPINVTDVPIVGNSLDSELGAVTQDGANLWRFPVHLASAIEFFWPAWGAGLKPQMPGLFAGLAFEGAASLDVPYTGRQRMLRHTSRETDASWIGRGRIARSRSGTLTYQTNDGFEFDEGLGRHFDQWSDGYLAWLIEDLLAADRAVLTVLPPGTYDARVGGGWGWPVLRAAWREWQPKPS